MKEELLKKSLNELRELLKENIEQSEKEFPSLIIKHSIGSSPFTNEKVAN
ncbi:hypothetical protein [uncultured Brevibacillus sp.]|nr:hypothetical protein [uncultured Brevibacillus sp.]